ncbi:MAG: elongation factor P [Anaerolineaceae bacterium]|nr:elongation factor P [Anaerolineaceae bacterium]
MIDVNDLRKGVIFEIDNSLFRVIEYSFNKPGRGNATIKIKAKDLRRGNTLEKTFTSGERVKDVRLDFHNAQYLYNDGELFYFMDVETYEQPAIPASIVGEYSGFLKSEMEVKLTFFENEPLDIELPTTVDLAVTYAEPAVKGDTATGVTKRVETETGLSVNVPYFVATGDKIRVDTRTGEYVTRV